MFIKQISVFLENKRGSFRMLTELLGKNGIEERQSFGKLSAFEQQALEGMLDTLKKDIALGEDFVNK